MNTLRSLLFRTLVPVSFATICVYVTYAKEGPALVPIARNLAWNDFITQIKFLPQDSPQDSIDKEMLVIQRFLKEHETETNVGVYDLAVFRAIRPGSCAFAQSRQGSGNAPKRIVLQGSTSKAGGGKP